MPVSRGRDRGEWDARRIDGDGALAPQFAPIPGAATPLPRHHMPPHGALVMPPSIATSSNARPIIRSYAAKARACQAAMTPAAIPSSRRRRNVVAEQGASAMRA
jgi:hypothetical protein